MLGNARVSFSCDKVTNFARQGSYSSQAARAWRGFCPNYRDWEVLLGKLGRDGAYHPRIAVVPATTINCATCFTIVRIIVVDVGLPVI